MNELTEEQKEDKFKNRKKMAWISIFCIVKVLFLTIYTDFLHDKSSGELDIINMCIFCLCSVVAYYFGATSYQYVKGR